jgi:hypothetical protein
MELSGLESATTLKQKLLTRRRFRIVWDHLGWFPPQVVPVLFPYQLDRCHPRMQSRPFSHAILLLPGYLIDG